LFSLAVSDVMVWCTLDYRKVKRVLKPMRKVMRAKRHPMKTVFMLFVFSTLYFLS